MQQNTSGSQARVFAPSLITVIFATLYSAAAVFAVNGILSIFTPGGRESFMISLVNAGITDPNAMRSWLIINSCLNIVVFLLALTMAVGLWVSFVTHKGLHGIAYICRGLWYAVRGLRIYLAVLFVYKALRYIISCIGDDEAAFYIFSMVFFEGSLAAVAAVLLLNLIKFFSAAADAADTAAYIIVTGNPEPQGISHIVSAGLFLTGSFFLLLGIGKGDDLFGRLSYCMHGCANILLGIYLRQCKHKLERLAHKPLDLQ